MKLFKWKKKSRSDDFSLPKTADFSLKSGELDGLPPISVRYWPAYSNPYQRLFYGRPCRRFEAQPGDAAAALSEMAAEADRHFCFHVHWLNFLFREAEFRGNDRSVFDGFLKMCGEIQTAGGIVAWTMHNLVEHESLDKAFEIEFRSALGALADIVVVHGDHAQAEAISAFSISPSKILNVPHGSYVGVYDDEIDRDEARANLNMASRDTIFANVGKVRPYKGLNNLVASVERLHSEGHCAGLVVAGEAKEVERVALEKILQSTQTVQAKLEFVPGIDLQLYLNAADFVALPYRSILTSGSAILGLSFARPLIAPAMGSLETLVQDGVNGFLYDPAAEDGLFQALWRAACTPTAIRAKMSRCASASATSLRWSDARAPFIDALARRIIG